MYVRTHSVAYGYCGQLRERLGHSCGSLRESKLFVFLAFFLPSFLFVGFVYADVVGGGGGSYACVSVGTPPKEKQAALLVGGFYVCERNPPLEKKKKTTHPPTMTVMAEMDSAGTVDIKPEVSPRDIKHHHPSSIISFAFGC